MKVTIEIDDLDEAKITVVRDLLCRLGSNAATAKQTTPNTPIAETVAQKADPSLFPPEALPLTDTAAASPAASDNASMMPSARELLVSAGIDPEPLRGTGSGKGGKFTKKDAEKYIAAQAPAEPIAPIADPNADPDTVAEFQALRTDLGKIVTAHGNEAATALLAQFGHDKVSAVPRDLYPQVTAAMRTQYPHVFAEITQAFMNGASGVDATDALG